MRTFISRRSAVLAAIAALAISAAAIAYWTAGGSGTGSGTAGTSTDNLQLVGTDGTGNPEVGDGIYPGGSVTVSFKVHNPNSFSVQPASATPTITVSNAYDEETNDDGCKASDFSMAAVALGDRINAGATSGTYTGTLSMADSAENQDGCKGQTITVALDSN